MRLNVNSETGKLKSVVLGIANSNGPMPKVEDAYDPKSLLYINEGGYPKEQDMIDELKSFSNVLESYNVKVYRPSVISDYNQIFSRDIGFVIDDKFVKSNILPARAREIEAIDFILESIDEENIIHLPENCHIEGGDVILHNDYIFIGTYFGEDYPDLITARTNREAVQAIEDLFPDKKIKTFQLRKSNIDPKENILHLDCCFQPVGKDKAILHKEGFLDDTEYQWLVDFFGEENVYQITRDEMFDMNSNVFSISDDVVVSEEKFEKLNNWLRKQHFTVETIKFSEIAKQDGLLRCTTLPLIRN